MRTHLGVGVEPADVFIQDMMLFVVTPWLTRFNVHLSAKKADAQGTSPPNQWR